MLYQSSSSSKARLAVNIEHMFNEKYLVTADNDRNIGRALRSRFGRRRLTSTPLRRHHARQQ